MSFMYFNVKENLLPGGSAISMVERNVGYWEAVTADDSLWGTAATCFIEDESKVCRKSKRCNLKPFHSSTNSFESVDLLSQDYPSPARDASTQQLSTCVCITEDAVVGRFAAPQTTVQSLKRPSVTPTRQPASFAMVYKVSQPEPIIPSPADDSSFPGPSTCVPVDANKGATLGNLQKPQTRPTTRPMKHPCLALIRHHQHPASCSSESKIAPPEPINSSGFLEPADHASRCGIGHFRHSYFPSSQPEYVVIDMEGISN